MENNKSLIKLTQKPVITHVLLEYGAKVTSRIDELNINKMIVTEDTIATMKKLRAELTKEANDFEDQRKAVKNAILSPYSDFENIYKTEIIEKYKVANETLKVKINDFEMKLKTERKNNLTAYFNEICEVEKIDWLKFEHIGIDINLSTSEKKYKESIISFVERVVSDIDMINTDEYAAEILVDYKKSLNASISITTIRRRKEAEKAEAARLLAARTQKRTSKLVGLCFVSHDMTRTYNWIKDENVMMSIQDVEAMSDDEWNLTFAEFEALVKASQEENKIVPLQAPIVKTPIAQTTQPEAKKKTLTATFEITDTFERLTELQTFLKLNNYTYKNIE